MHEQEGYTTVAPILQSFCGALEVIESETFRSVGHTSHGDRSHGKSMETVARPDASQDVFKKSCSGGGDASSVLRPVNADGKTRRAPAMSPASPQQPAAHGGIPIACDTPRPNKAPSENSISHKRAFGFMDGASSPGKRQSTSCACVPQFCDAPLIDLGGGGTYAFWFTRVSGHHPLDLIL